MEFVGSSALVTGAGRGIGRAIALELAKQGIQVTAVSRTLSELSSLETEGQGRIFAFPVDLRQPDAPRRTVEKAVAAHGGLQILVNNAGIGLHTPLRETTDEDWDNLLTTNLTSVFRLTRAAIPHLERKGGHIFMISSLAGQNPIAGMSAYCASKAALDHLSRCLMLEVRHQGIKVTTIAPGSVDTSFGMPSDSDRSWMLSAEDVAQAVIDLLRVRDGAHLSRLEMRPSRPKTRA